MCCLCCATASLQCADQDLKLHPLNLSDLDELTRSKSLWLQLCLKGPETSGNQTVDAYDERSPE